MKKKTKIFSIVLGVIIVSGIALHFGSAELFQGRMFKTSKPLPAYDENKCYDSDGGKNYEKQGIAYGKLEGVRTARTSFSDYCEGGTYIEYYCSGNKVKKEEIASMDFCPVSLNSIVQEKIPKAWIDTFDADFKIVFEPYMESIELPNGGWIYDEDTKVEFSTKEQKIIKDMLYKAIYSMSRVDSYLEKKLPWTNGETYYNWLKNSLGTINFTANPNIKGGGAAANDIQTIYLNGYTLLDHTKKGALEAWSYQFPELLEKTGIVLTVDIINHEVRHLNNINHSSCRGSDNMDENLKMMGAHGVNIIVRHWITYLLPESMTAKALLENGDGLEYTVWIDRMCSLDVTTGELNEEDKQWMENISGYPLDYDKDVMWTVSY